MRIGIDACEHNRIASDLYRLANKILSVEELGIFNNFKSQKRQVEYVASRFAAKEAIFKALGENIGQSYKDYAILNDSRGKPYVVSQLALDINISITHTNDLSIVFITIPD